MSTATVTPEQENELAAAIRGITDALPAEAQTNAHELMDRMAEGATMGDLYGIDQDRLEAVYSVAHNMYGNGKFDDALTMFRFLTVMDYSETRFWMGLGATQQMMADYEGAVQSYAYATMLDIEDPRPQIQAGYCLMQMGQLEIAQTALEGVLLAEQLDPGLELQAEAMLNRIERELLDTEE